MTINAEPVARTTRELWLENAIDIFRPRFAELEYPLPKSVHVSVGFGYGAKRESAQILGQCWKRCASDDNINHVFISPEIADTGQVLATLLHELIHAALDCEDGHRGRFDEIAGLLGFEGSRLGIDTNIELTAELMTIAATLGTYPHGALHASMANDRTPVGPDGQPIPRGPRPHSGPAPQTNRQRLCVCPSCGYRVRTTAKWLAIGNPRCPAGDEMLPAD